MRSQRYATRFAPVIGLAVIFGLGFATANFTHRPARVTADSDELVFQELRRAQSIGNNIFQCRSLIGNGGTFRKGLEAGWWESVLPRFQEEGLPSLPNDETTVIIFVHGYNVTLDGSVVLGNAIWPQLQRAANRAGSSPSVRQLVFCTFCWRGDFGPERFGASEKSAMNTAASLAGFIAKLEAQAASVHKDVSVILIGHSLGAMVCLEAMNQLWRQEERPWIKCLFMLQAAVPVESVSHGQYSETVVWSEPGPAGRPLRHLEHTVHTNSAKYCEGFQAARLVLATTSSADNVLDDVYFAHDHPPGSGMERPGGREALGAATWTARKSPEIHLEFPANLRIIDMSPGKRVERIRAHGDITDNQPLFDLLWGELLKLPDTPAQAESPRLPGS